MTMLRTCTLLVLLSFLRPTSEYHNAYQTLVGYDLEGLRCSPSLTLSASLWLPPRLTRVRGLLVLTGGQGNFGSEDTRPDIAKELWRNWATTNSFGLVGTRFTGDYKDSTLGSGVTLLNALTDLARFSQHPEIESVPLIVSGFSNGGYFSFTFASEYPERVLAFGINKSGFAQAPITSDLVKIPGMLIKGALEECRGVPSVIDTLHQTAIETGAPWIEAVDYGAGHETGKAEPMLAQFFSARIAQFFSE